jgi:hypothetical protein
MRRAIGIACAVFSVAGCKGSATGIAGLGPDAFVEKFEGANIGWVIDGDDRVRAVVEGSDGKPLGKDVTGSLVYKAADGSTKTVALAPDPKSGALVAAGPKLDAPLTEVAYTVDAAGKPLSGTMYVPKGGTVAIAADAKISVDGGASVGPHGGHVERVGSDWVEVVASKNGEVRAYVLDGDRNPVAPGARKIVLGVEAERPELVVLQPEPSGRFLIGRWHVHGDPKRMTVGVETGGELHAVLVGWHPGVVVLAEPVALGPHVVVVEDWDDGVRVTPHGVVVVRQEHEEREEGDRPKEKDGPREKEIDIKVLPNGKVKIKGAHED